MSVLSRPLVRPLVRLSATLALLLSVNLAAADTGLVIENPWLRATPAGASVGAGYATLLNAGDKAIVVVGVETDASRAAELHSMTHDNGMMRMRRLERLEVPAKGSARLAPHGNHLMLFDLKAPLVAGQSVPVRFVLDDGSRVTATFSVRSAAP